MNESKTNTITKKQIPNIKELHKKIKEKNSKKFHENFNNMEDLCFDKIVLNQYSIISINN
jgi:hypothetical protein